MGLAPRFGLAAVAAAAAVAVTASTSTGGAQPSGVQAAATKVTGIVTATNRPNAARVHVSLHNLQPDTSYRVTATSRGCGVASEDGKVWAKQFRTPLDDDVYRASTVPRSGSLADVRSLRLYRLASGGATRETCKKKIPLSGGNFDPEVTLL